MPYDGGGGERGGGGGEQGRDGCLGIIFSARAEEERGT